MLSLKVFQMQSMNLHFFMSFHLQAQAPTDADRGTQNGGQINEKSRDFSANARETS